MRRPKPVHQMTIAQFEATFTDEDDCRRYLVARRWPKGVNCPRCGNTKVYALASRPSLAMRSLPSERLSLLAYRRHHF